MTAYSIWGQAAPSPSPSYGSSGASTTYSTVFTLSASGVLTGIWYYSGASDGPLPDACGVFDVATKTLVASNLSPSWSGAQGSGWVKCTFPGTTTLDTRVHGYAVSIHVGNQTKGYNSITFPVTNGIITAPSADTYGNTNAPYAQGTSLTYPNTNGGGLNWFADVEVSTSAAPNAGPPPRIPHPRFLDLLVEGAWQRADRQAQGVADLTVAYASTTSGVDTYNVTSPYNGGVNQPMRVLAPTAPSGSYPHSFLLMLPVELGEGTTYGDPIGVAQTLGASNAYNLTCIEPGFTADPWYADNPLDPAVQQETYLLKLLAWIKAHLATAGNEKVYLIGFSKSGLGGQSLQFRHPQLFAATASWDAPFMITDYDGTDPTYGGTVGGNSATVYGTSSSFQTHYELSAANLANWKAAYDFGTYNRIWIGGYSAFSADVTAYDTALTTAGIKHTYTYSTSETHAWNTDWVAAALASIIPSNYAEASTVLPQQIPHPLFMDLLEVAARRMLPDSVTASAPTGVAMITGQGALGSADGTGSGGTLGGQGSLGSPDVTQQQDAGATLTGAGSLGTPDVTEQAPATLTGAGALTTAVTESAVATITGQGALATAATEQAPATLTGQGSLGTPDVTEQAGSSLAGGGSLGQPDSIIVVPATLAGQGSLNASTSPTGSGSMTGQGSLAAPAVQGAGLTIAGGGSLGQPDAIESVTGLITGAGSLSGTGTSGGGQGGNLTGGGQLGSVVILQVPATITGQGAISATATVPGSLPPLPDGITTGKPYSRWSAGQPYSRWSAADPHG